MSDPEEELRERLSGYLDATTPAAVPAVLGVCLTGSLAAGHVDEYSDLDLTVVLAGDGTDADPDRVGAAVVPDDTGAVQRRDALSKYSFDWCGCHVDVDVVALADLRAAAWDLRTRWEYDNAEVLVDPTDRVGERLAAEVPLEEVERAALVAEHADELLFAGQWDVHRACRRGSFEVAHRAAARAAEAAVVLVFLRDGAFRPRDKWLVAELEALPSTDADTRDLVWEATRAVERTPEDVHRRVVALRDCWERVAADLRASGVLEAEHGWEAPPEELCCLA